MGIIERAQEQLGADLQRVQAELARLHVEGVAPVKREKEQRDSGIVEVRNGAGEEDAGEFKSAAEIAIEELQKKVDGVIETIKLECVPSFIDMRVRVDG